MPIHVHLEASFIVRSRSVERLESHLDGVLEELEHLVGITDADYTAGLADGDVTISFDHAYDGDRLEEALSSGMACLRTAIHAAGGNTHNWPTFDEAFPELRQHEPEDVSEWSDVKEFHAALAG